MYHWPIVWDKRRGGGKGEKKKYRELLIRASTFTTAIKAALDGKKIDS